MTPIGQSILVARSKGAMSWLRKGLELPPGGIQAWQDYDEFRRVQIGETGELIWPSGVDLCPDALYLKVTDRKPEQEFPALKHELVHAGDLKVLEDSDDKLSFFMNPEESREPNCEGIFLQMQEDAVVKKSYSRDGLLTTKSFLLSHTRQKVISSVGTKQMDKLTRKL